MNETEQLMVMELKRSFVIIGSMLLGGCALAVLETAFFHDGSNGLAAETAPNNTKYIYEEAGPDRPEDLDLLPRRSLASEKAKEPEFSAALATKIRMPAETAAGPSKFELPQIASATPVSAEPIAEAGSPPIPEVDISVDQAVEEDSEESRLVLKPKLSVGASYLNYAQSGAFGAAKGSTEIFNALAFQMKMKFDKWHLRSGIESASAKFSTDAANTGPKDSRKIRNFFVKPGYRNIFFGVKSGRAPILRVSGSTIQWADVTSLSAVGGLHFEKLYYPGRRRKPYMLGFDLEGAFPISAASDGVPAVSSPKGYGFALRGSGASTISANEAYRASVGLETDFSYDRTQFSGTWSGSSGTVTRTIFEIGSKVYIQVEF